MNLVRQSPEVYLAPGPISSIGQKEIEFLMLAVVAAPRGRVRINAHPRSDDSLHEMFIAIRADSYIRPHKHSGKSEAFHLVHGKVDVVVFDDSGEIEEVVQLGESETRAFYYRLSAPRFHTLVIHSDIVVLHEITNGPFVPGATAVASFAPEESNSPGIAAYMAELSARAAAFIRES